jgi:hypothetical protein
MRFCRTDIHNYPIVKSNNFERSVCSAQGVLSEERNADTFVPCISDYQSGKVQKRCLLSIDRESSSLILGSIELQ